MPLLLSLSRGSKILKAILCEEELIMAYLRQKMLIDDTSIKVLANISLDNKAFLDQLP